MKDLTNGNVFKKIIIFSGPLILGQLIQQSYVIVDNILAGQYLGKEALAAIGASFPVIFAVVSFIIGIVSGTSVVIAQFYGAKDLVSVKKAIDTMYAFVFFFALLLTIIGILFCEKIFQLIGLPQGIIPIAKDYFTIFLSGLILMFGFNGTNAVLRGLGDSKTPLIFIIFSTLLNIILDVVFVVVLKMGVKGIALATVIAQGLGFLFSWAYLNKYHSVFNFSLRNIQYDKTILTKSLKIGIPTGLQQISVAFSMVIMYAIVNMYGTDVIAAYTVGSRISNLAGIPAMGFGLALSTFVGQNIGANKSERVKAGLISTLIISLLVTFIFSLVCFLFSKEIMSVFINNNNIINIGSEYLNIISFFFLSFSLMYTFNSFLMGAGDTLIPSLISILILWGIRIPIAAYFSHHFNEKMIWWSFPFSWTLAMILSGLYYSTGRWKNKSVLKNKDFETETKIDSIV